MKETFNHSQRAEESRKVIRMTELAASAQAAISFFVCKIPIGKCIECRDEIIEINLGNESSRANRFSTLQRIQNVINDKNIHDSISLSEKNLVQQIIDNKLAKKEDAELLVNLLTGKETLGLEDLELYKEWGKKNNI